MKFFILVVKLRKFGLMLRENGEVGSCEEGGDKAVKTKRRPMQPPFLSYE